MISLLEYGQIACKHYYFIVVMWQNAKTSFNLVILISKIVYTENIIWLYIFTIWIKIFHYLGFRYIKFENNQNNLSILVSQPKPKL